MNHFFLFLLPFCAAAVSDYYVEPAKIRTFVNKVGNDKTFTYYVDDSYYQYQKDEYKIEVGSIGSFWPDDHGPEGSESQCQPFWCPNNRRIYIKNVTSDGKTTMRLHYGPDYEENILYKSAGYLSERIGYCSSNGNVPIFEMYSDALKQYAYWSPLQPHQLVDLTSTSTIDTSRYKPVRFLGWAIDTTDRFDLEDSAPAFTRMSSRTVLGSQSYYAWQLIQFTSGSKLFNFVAPPAVDAYKMKEGFSSKNTGIFLIGKGTSIEFSKLSQICGEFISLYTASDVDKTYGALFPRFVDPPMVAIAHAGYTFKNNNRICGGLKGLAALMELKHKTNPNQYIYENDVAKITALIGSGEWEFTSKALGYAPLDQIGFILINKPHYA